MRKALLLVGLAACGSGGGGGGGDDVQGTPDAPASMPGTWHTLIEKSWSLAPHSENTSEIGVDTLDHDVYIGGLRPIAPIGTHHTLLFRGLSATNAIYASGIGTGELVFPVGKGMKIPAGTALGLQLHIYNTGDDPLTGTSGVEYFEVDPSTVTDEVDLFLPGPKNLDIPPNVSTATGTCTIGTSQTLFALFPHMHQWGVHFKTVLNVAGTDMTLHDDDYTFEHQDVESFTPIAVSPGDTITTSCTYNNTTGANISYGESTDTEMCYSIMYRWPKVNDGEFCTH
jgi:hypothetical protein